MRRTGFRKPTPAEAKRWRSRTVELRESRAGSLPPLPRDWRDRCRQVRERDGGRCRYCGWRAEGSAINHIIPRRVADPARVHALENLCVLCLTHHAEITHRAERALFRGEPDLFFRFLSVIATTGPCPSPETVGTALERLRLMLDGPCPTRSDSERGDAHAD